MSVDWEGGEDDSCRAGGMDRTGPRPAQDDKIDGLLAARMRRTDFESSDLCMVPNECGSVDGFKWGVGGDLRKVRARRPPLPSLSHPLPARPTTRPHTRPIPRTARPLPFLDYSSQCSRPLSLVALAVPPPRALASSCRLVMASLLRSVPSTATRSAASSSSSVVVCSRRSVHKLRPYPNLDLAKGVPNFLDPADLKVSSVFLPSLLWRFQSIAV